MTMQLVLWSRLHFLPFQFIFLLCRGKVNVLTLFLVNRLHGGNARQRFVVRAVQIPDEHRV